MVIEHIFNINELGKPAVYNEFINQMMDIAECIDNKYGSNYQKRIERGNMSVGEMLVAMKFGEAVFTDYDNEADKYEMIPFSLYKKKTQNGDTHIYFVYSSTKENNHTKKLKDWVKCNNYEILDNMNVLNEDDSYNAIISNKTIVIVNKGVYLVE